MTDQKQPATSDSAVYKHTFYGILNKDGDFWTPLAFANPERATQFISDYWRSPANRERALSECKIVPVRIQLTELTHG